MKKAVYRLILFAAITAFVLSLSPSVKADPNDMQQTKQNQDIASDTKALPNADKSGPTPQQESADSKENFQLQLQLAKEQLRGEFYKDSQDNLKWAIKVIIGLVTAYIGLALVTMGYLVFKNKKDYTEAVADAKEAARDAKDAAKNARELEREAQGVLADFEKQTKAKLEEIDTKANDNQKYIDKLVADKLDDIEKTSKEQKEESSKEFERQRKISELLNKGRKADEAKDYETAAEYYRQIVEDLKEEDDPSVYNNWGSTLWDLATSKKGKEAEGLFRQAIEKYQKAINIKLDFCEAHNNWGTALSGLARLKKGTEAEELFKQAIEKLQKAINIKPGYYNSHNNWGTVLCELAKLKKGMEAEELFKQAIEKFQKAIDLKPDFCESYYGWGFALTGIAKNKKGTEAEELLNQAIEKYQKILEIKADYWRGYNSWGLALLYLAKLKDGKEAEDILKQAEEKCLKAKSIEAGQGAYVLACIYVHRGNEYKCQEWLKVGEKAETLPTREYAMGDDDLKSVRDKDWFKELRWKGE